MERIGTKVIAIIVAIAVIAGVVLWFGNPYFDSIRHAIKGRLIGVSYVAEAFDNYGTLLMTMKGDNIDITGNKVSELGFDSSGDSITNYSLSSVLNITIDGKEIQSCGNSIIFAESGLKKDVDFRMRNIESQNDGNLMNFTSVAKVINEHKNFFGKPRVIVIQSQMGVPICAYSGDEIYWEIPEDLPKMTKIMIDGKALYIHRVNFMIIDTNLL